MAYSKARSVEQGHVDENRRVEPMSSWNESKRQAVDAASRQVPPSADARQAMGFMPMKMKGAAIRWRGL